MNHDPLYPTITAGPMPQSPGDETICGYPIRDLVIFADACRVAGVGPKELKDFVGNVEATYGVVAKAMDEHLTRSLVKYLKPSICDGADDPEIVYTRAKFDQKLAQILGDRFVPWEARYGA